MNEMQQAHHELDSLQSIITRHEGHMFALRGWLLTVLGGFLAAYYTGMIDMPAIFMRLSLPVIVILFLIVDLRHGNLVEALVERVVELEDKIRKSRDATGEAVNAGWYDGPKVSKTCEKGANRWRPREEMTFILNRSFYLIVILIIVIAAVSLPQRKQNSELPANSPAAPEAQQ